MQVAIGLPKFLLEAENQLSALIVAFVLILILIPICFFYWYSSSQTTDDKGILVDSQRKYFALINENLIFNQMPSILTITDDFAHIKIKGPKDAATLDNIRRDHLGEYAPKIDQKKKRWVNNLKPWTLVLAYLNGVTLSKENKLILDDILKKVPGVIEMWIGIGL